MTAVVDIVDRPRVAFQVLEYQCPWCGCLNRWPLPSAGSKVLVCQRDGCNVATAVADGVTREIRFFLKQSEHTFFRLISEGVLE